MPGPSETTRVSGLGAAPLAVQVDLQADVMAPAQRSVKRQQAHGDLGAPV